ncbi:dihydrofolate reductase family protein [Amycolatopsis sp. H20-H5]|uniref:dihydrofolate reductase family protein n=1 Tax=Amycolatopsis sp. H20-H5 TaxID=3046309 RepID=UPI002DBE71BF|nr:dihydrofolate reductase family protein [Amycolatopsis sp. H20-H5]MEC3979070.1 dihydrofolate reductase family protein [Amycolatopsis sp. H20-H5]
MTTAGLTVRPHVVVSAAMSLDGRLDDASPQRLLLSDAADLDRVDEVRAGADAILVGAGTVRADDPRLLVRSAVRRRTRVAAGRPPSPLRVVLTGGGALDPQANVFRTGTELAATLVLMPPGATGAVRGAFGPSVEVTSPGEELTPRAVLGDLARRGVVRLMVEGGSTTLTSFFAAGLVDEVQLVVAPFLVGDHEAQPFLRSGQFPQGPDAPMTLVEARPMGDHVLLRYRAGAVDRRWLAEACALAERCHPSASAFSVGAVVVSRGGEVIATGYSRCDLPADHAEEAALRSVRHDPRVAGATIYTSLEPCGNRASSPISCAQHILDAGIARVVTAWREPPTFTRGDGVARLRAAGVEVVELPELGELARRPNHHLRLGAGRLPA